MFPGLQLLRRNALALTFALLSMFLALPLGAQTVRAGVGTAALPSFTWNNDLNSGLYRFGADTIGVATNGLFTARFWGGATGKLALPGDAEIHGGTAAGSSLSLLTRDAANASLTHMALAGTDTSTVFIGLVRANATGEWQLAQSTAAATPPYSFVNDLDLGVYRFGADTLGIATSGASSLGIRGGASPTIFGGAGNMTIQAGTGNNRTLTLQTTTTAGTATTALTLDSAQNTVIPATKRLCLDGASGVCGNTFINEAASDQINVTVGGTATTIFGSGYSSFTAVVNMTGLTAASGTPNSICMNAATEEVTVNAALTCTVSAARFKKNIIDLSLPTATRIVTQLRPRTFTYREGGRRAIGLIAEQADTVDTRLSTRNADGQINSVNYEQVSIVLLKVVQDQQRRLDALCKSGHAAAC